MNSAMDQRDEERREKFRIQKLEDDKIDNMCKQIGEIHHCIFGNGSPGLKTIVSNNVFCLKILGWGVGVIYTAGIGWIVVEVLKLI